MRQGLMSEIVSNTDLKWVFCRSKKNKRGEKKYGEKKEKKWSWVA